MPTTDIYSDVLDPQMFRRTCSIFATGVTVTTVLDSDGRPHGITLNSFTSVSLFPPLILVCIDKRSQVMQHFRIGTTFGVNVLREGQEELSRRFSRHGPDRFQDIPWRPGNTGIPLLESVLATIECLLAELNEAGDHWIVIGEVLHADCSDGNPLAFFRSSYRNLATECAAAAPQPHNRSGTLGVNRDARARTLSGIPGAQ